MALSALDWKFLAIYCGWIAFEYLFIYFLYPETQVRTLEELAFCKYLPVRESYCNSNVLLIVFEDKHLADEAVVAVEKEIHRDVSIDGKHAATVHTEEAGPRAESRN
jgi:hypothetical protein